MEISYTLKQHVLSCFEQATLDEIIINGATSMVLYDQAQRAIMQPSPYHEITSMIADLQQLSRSASVRLDPNTPAGGGDLCYDLAVGSIHLRWHAVIAPAVREGAVVSFRRHRFSSLQLSDFNMTQGSDKCLEHILDDGAAVFICGETGSGKSSLLSALLTARDPLERVVFLEKSAEIDLRHPNWVRLLARRPNLEGHGQITLQDLFEQALRLRPDRIVIGEIRGEEAPIVFQAMITGHLSMITTMHLSSPELALARLSQLVGNSGAIDWRQLFQQVQPYVVMMKRGSPPLVEGVYQYRECGFVKCEGFG